jgi:hypothetical protein
VQTVQTFSPYSVLDQFHSSALSFTYVDSEIGSLDCSDVVWHRVVFLSVREKPAALRPGHPYVSFFFDNLAIQLIVMLFLPIPCEARSAIFTTDTFLLLHCHLFSRGGAWST